MTQQQLDTTTARRKQSHIFEKEEHQHYVEPFWCSQRLFDIESIPGDVVHDPCCGWGRVVKAAVDAGYRAFGSDIVDRSKDSHAETVPGAEFFVHDFLGEPSARIKSIARKPYTIVGNPPFNMMEEFVERALSLGAKKVCFIWRLTRLPAARYMQEFPLARIHLLNPRPSMPPDPHIASGGRVGGDSHDYAWLVFVPGYTGAAQVHWLLRDGD
jgi:hypothetical protein